MLMSTLTPLVELENACEFVARHIGPTAADEQHMLGAIGAASRRALIEAVVPRGIVHRYRFADRPARLLVIESAGYVRTPKRYRNEFGQLTENAPFSERDIRRPADLETIDRKGEFPIVVKKDGRLTRVVRNPNYRGTPYPCEGMPEDEAAGNDAQLKAATEDLLKRIGG